MRLRFYGMLLLYSAAAARAVNSLRVKFHANIYVTGSNSRLLSGELATYTRELL